MLLSTLSQLEQAARARAGPHQRLSGLQRDLAETWQRRFSDLAETLQRHRQGYPEFSKWDMMLSHEYGSHTGELQALPRDQGRHAFSVRRLLRVPQPSSDSCPGEGVREGGHQADFVQAPTRPA